MAKNFSRAFTLIELLVVIAVIAILVSIAYPVFTGVQERAKVTKDMNNLRQIGLATQTYMNDNDGVLFSTAVGAGSWMVQLHQKYLPAWSVFQSPFDTRAPSELGTVATPISYGINGTANFVGTSADKISNSSVFILFAPAQASTPTVTFQGTAVTAAPGVQVLRAASTPGGSATGGTHSSRRRINALFADLHSENMLWSVFTNTPPGSDPSALQRWTP
jgi:prepilin-type N-terminal cleavage/methylation domain-containing protein